MGGSEFEAAPGPRPRAAEKDGHVPGIRKYVHVWPDNFTGVVTELRNAGDPRSLLPWHLQVSTG